jgi:SNF2 family DNA or RNA helicase
MNQDFLKSIKIKPFDYQLRDVEKMISAEKESNGGLNRNPSGTGKTIEFLLLLFNRQEDNNNYRTLIISPNLRIIDQIKQEIQKISSINFSQLSKYNQEITSDDSIILTTKKTFLTNKSISNISWFRIIFDEAHHIKNPRSKTRKKLIDLNFEKLWLVTSTPDLNGFQDYESLNNIFSDYFNSEQSIVIENKKEFIFKELKVPDLKEKIIKLELSNLEVKLYREFLSRFSDKFNSSSVEEQRFWLIASSFLRRFCDGLGTKIPTETKRIFSIINSVCSNCEKQKTCLFFKSCKVYICLDCVKKDDEDLSLFCPKCFSRISYLDLFMSDNNKDLIKELQCKEKSRKIEYLIDYLRVIDSKKIIILTEWSSAATVLEETLKNDKQGKYKNILKIEGKIRTKKRNAILKTFKEAFEPSILIMTLQSCEGLKLTEADHVIILEPYWNYGTEQKVIEKIHGIGQEKEVFTTRFLTEGTIEELIYKVQRKKLKEKQKIRVKDIINFSNMDKIFNRRYK